MAETVSFSRNIGLLAACQALFFCANAMIISTVALVGKQIAPTESLATLPLGIQFFTIMATTMAASLFMAKVGRRIGLMVGALFAIASGLLGWWSIMHAHFVAFCVSGALYGTFGAFAGYYRFAAADVADDRSRARAIAYVMAGGVVAGVLGPELAKQTVDWFAPISFAGTYGAIAILGGLSLFLLAFLTIPKPVIRQDQADARPLIEIAKQPAFLIALFTAVTAYVVMNLLMTATPLAMEVCGFRFEDSAFVIQAHILGMFAPSFVTGHLIQRFGTFRVIGAGIVLLLICTSLHLSGIQLIHFTLGLLALGVGWNFLFIGATTLLTEVHKPSEKAKVQGLNDLLLFSFVALSATASGALHNWVGWQAMNLGALIFILVLAALLLSQKSLSARSAAV